MLELYHWEPHGACARALICLHEKQLGFASRYVDPAEHEVPMLVRDGRAYTNPSAIGEFLEAVSPDIMLMPQDAGAREETRAWQRYVDDCVAEAVNDLARGAYESPPLRDRERLAWARERLTEALHKTEAALAHADWLTGASYSLADIAVFSYFAYLPRLTPSLMNESATPHTYQYIQRVVSRPAVKAALSMARTPDPFMVVIPANAEGLRSVAASADAAARTRGGGE